MAAHALDGKANVVLIEREDALTHSMATLRAATLGGTTYKEQMRVPYNGLLKRGRVVQGSAESVTPGKVKLTGGEEIPADYIIMATGGRGFHFPLQAQGKTTAEYNAMLDAARDQIAEAGSVAVVGGGPVGIEMAGEIKAAHPDKPVTVVHSGGALLSGNVQPTDPRLSASLLRQMEDMGITVILNARMQTLPHGESAGVSSAICSTPGQSHSLSNGESLKADLVFVAAGPKSSTAPPAVAMLPVGTTDGAGFVKVNKQLQVEGMEGVYAIGDCVNVPETKLAYSGGLQAKVVVNNVIVDATGKGSMKDYELLPEGKAGMLVTLGPKRGAGAFGKTQLGSFMVSNIKGKSLLTSILMGDRGMKAVAN
mmetsp:Transcript_22079/g.67829  ORF Transcript_22079/g.67829 Transcript_22079/m.67829 type:complete len:367 (-) Transcript_22079:165-1265(-)